MVAFLPKSLLLCISKKKYTTMLKFLKNWTLPIAMLVGAVVAWRLQGGDAPGSQ
jgi:BASS family bile acid:Na+ symporter